MDILFRVPGFQLEEAEDRRGLGQGGANVLIDGQRLSTKNSDASEQLSRILSSNVLRIEVLDSYAVKIPGLTGRVTNIVTNVSGIFGAWEWSVRQLNFADVASSVNLESNLTQRATPI